MWRGYDPHADSLANLCNQMVEALHCTRQNTSDHIRPGYRREFSLISLIFVCEQWGEDSRCMPARWLDFLVRNRIYERVVSTALHVSGCMIEQYSSGRNIYRGQ